MVSVGVTPDVLGPLPLGEGAHASASLCFDALKKLLTFFRGSPLGYCHCSAHTTSRDPEEPGSLCLLV